MAYGYRVGLGLRVRGNRCGAPKLGMAKEASPEAYEGTDFAENERARTIGNAVPYGSLR